VFNDASGVEEGSLILKRSPWFLPSKMIFFNDRSFSFSMCRRGSVVEEVEIASVQFLAQMTQILNVEVQSALVPQWVLSIIHAQLRLQYG
jgi:hypothetical protein